MLAALSASSTTASAAYDSLRCGNKLVGVDASAAEVVAACGEPALREFWTSEAPKSGNWISDTEQWTYDFGPQQLLRVLKLRRGRLVDVDTDGYGFRPGSTSGHCEPSALINGMGTYRLLKLCGEPLTRRKFNGLRPLRGGSPRYPGSGDYHDQYLTPVYREEWVYNFGSRYFMRELMLENGRINRIENGARGVDKP